MFYKKTTGGNFHWTMSSKESQQKSDLMALFYFICWSFILSCLFRS